MSFAVNGLYPDAWSGIDVWFDFEDAQTCRFELFLPANPGAASDKIVAVLCGTDVHCVRLPRGQIRRIGPLPIPGRTRVALAFAEAEPKHGGDGRERGAKFVRLILDDRVIDADGLRAHARTGPQRPAPASLALAGGRAGPPGGEAGAARAREAP